jgi:hypothetical protein
MLYADEIEAAGFAGDGFAGDVDCLVVRSRAREWLIETEFGVLLSDQPASGIETVGLVKQTSDGWAAELVRVEGGDLAVLMAPGARLFGGPFPGWAVVTKVWDLASALGWGFSPSGRTLVLAGPGMVWSYARMTEG